MVDRSSSSGDQSKQPDSLLAEFLCREHVDMAADFEALCSKHSEHEAELRALWAVRERLNREVSFFRNANPEESRPGETDSARAGDSIGDFTLITRIARGGQGEVWEAEQRSLGRRVALKLVLPGRVNQKTLALFAREARAGGRLNHPGIVAVHGYGQDDGQHWIAQELVEGSWTLRDFIDEMRSAEELPSNYYQAVAEFLAELGDALQAAHAAGVIHRDIKPQNILVAPDDRPKLTDFGLARIAEEAAVSMTGDFAGTWLYMSPEQVTAKRIEVDHRTDIFSLGVVMYEMLSLQRPFDGDTTHQIAENIIYREAPDLVKIRSRVPKDLAVICAKALEKRKSDRYAEMSEFAGDLRRHLTHVPIQAQSPSRVERTRKWVRRHPTKAALTASALVMISAFIALGLLIAQQNQRLRSQTFHLSQSTAKAQKVSEELALEAAENLRLAKLHEATAARTAQEVRHLRLAEDYESLISQQASLWPPHPELIGELEVWIARTKRLHSEMPGLRARLLELQTKAVDSSEAEDGGFSDEWWIDRLAQQIDDLESLWLEGQGLMTESGVDPELGWSVPRRLSFARHLAAEYQPGGKFAMRWDAALPLINEQYPGVELPIQIGLVPIGRDPNSGLWEFWHVQSGARPIRAWSGRLMITNESGLVFVLLPGASFLMGAQRRHSAGANYDRACRSDEGPIHPVELEAFFLSKYEMTDGQWLRLTGTHSQRRSPNKMDRVSALSMTRALQYVSWSDCMRQMGVAGLTLPSEAEWEYGARAGTDTAWSAGDLRRGLNSYLDLLAPTAPKLAHYGRLTAYVSLVATINFVAASSIEILGRSAQAKFDAVVAELNSGVRSSEPLAEGVLPRAAHDKTFSPALAKLFASATSVKVAKYTPNQFGLHGTHSNVWEWCLDAYDPAFYSRSPVSNPLNASVGSEPRVSRGGGIYANFLGARSSERAHVHPGSENELLGIRPAKPIEQSAQQ